MRQLPSKSPPPILTSTPLYCPPLSPLTLHSLPYYILRPNSVIHMVGNTYVVLFWRQVQAAICSDVTCEEHHNTSDARQTCRDTKVHLDIHPRAGVQRRILTFIPGEGMYRAAGHMVSVTIGSPRPTILVDPPPVDAHVNLSARKQISIALKLDSNLWLQKR